MSVYEIRIKDESGCVSSSGIMSKGDNAMDAFENAYATGQIYLLSGQMFNVLCVNTETGLAIEFKAAIA